MRDQLQMFDKTTSEDTGSATSSPESESGATPSGLRDGKTTAKSGPAPAPASPSPQPAKAKRSTIKGIFGQSGFHSSKHEDLSFALGSRLRPLTDSLGSTLFSLTWMVRITPAGRSISALRASEPLTEGSVFIGWPTPNTPSGGPNSKSTETHTGGMALDGAATLVGWPENQEPPAIPLPRWLAGRASLTAWGDASGAGLEERDASQETLDRNARPLSELARLAGWKTPCVPNGGRISGNAEDLGKHRDGTKAQIGLENEAKLSGWATPKVASGDYQYSNGDHSAIALNLSGEAQLTAFGETPIGYLLGPNGWEIVPASGQLSAAHSRWLMGLPSVWDDCGVTAMESLPKRRRRS